MHTSDDDADLPAVTISDRLDGRRVLVTGASKGTGAAIAARLREAGATVLGTARTAPPSHPGPRDFVVADLTSPDGAARVAAHEARDAERELACYVVDLNYRYTLTDDRITTLTITP